MSKEIRISGSGGQGVVLAGIILAEAAGIFEDKYVIQLQDYGGAMRGGAVSSEVLIADEEGELEYPGVLNADILVAMTQEAADRWTASVKKDGIVVFDSTNVAKPPRSVARTYEVPLTRIAQEKLGRKNEEVIRAMGAFGGGLGGNGEVCGALVGALAVLGLRFSRAREDEKEDPRMWSYAQELLKRFRDEIVKNQSGFLCREIAGVDWNDKEQVRAFRKSEKVLECGRIVGETAVLIGELLETITKNNRRLVL